MTKIQPRCCPCPENRGPAGTPFTRREFLKGAGATALGSVAAGGLAWPRLAGRSATADEVFRPAPLKVKPILVYDTPRRRPQTSWRNWGGIETEADAQAEMARIRGELAALSKKAEFPVDFLPVAPVKRAADLAGVGDIADADVLLVYAAGGWMDVFDALGKTGKDLIFFCRHKSGPVYLWYEIISPRYLRQHTDSLAVEGVDDDDVVIDSQDEILWRLRALCGLKNTMGTEDPGRRRAGRLGPAGRRRAQARRRDVEVRHRHRVLRRPGRADPARPGPTPRPSAGPGPRAEAYLRLPGTTPRDGARRSSRTPSCSSRSFAACCKEADCRALTINGCMGTIMPLAETTACLTLSTLNDDGYLAFCESDFVVIPSGILLANISGQPRVPQRPDLSARRHHHPGPLHGAAEDGRPDDRAGPDPDPLRVGLRGRPQGRDAQGPDADQHRPRLQGRALARACRARSSSARSCPSAARRSTSASRATSRTLAKRMPGFHWMTGYGDYHAELGYALKRVGIEWDFLG